jgi:hypothetical protein
MTMKRATPDRNAGVGLRSLVILGAVWLAPLLVLAAAPAWWAARGVVNSGVDDDYAAINQGQLKNLAQQAYAELRADLPASAWTNAAATNLATLVASFSLTNNNYDAVNGGQLKGVAKPFYAFLIANGYATNYPWAANTNAPDDYAMANIGQAKYLFSFNPAAFPAPPASPSH